MRQHHRTPAPLGQDELIWALGSICALHRLPFNPDLLAREFPPPTTDATLVAAGRALGLQIKATELRVGEVQRQVLPLIVGLRADALADEVRALEEPSDPAEHAPATDVGTRRAPTIGIVTAVADGKLILFKSGSSEPLTLTIEAFDQLADGRAWMTKPVAEGAHDPDATAGTTKQFGFRWFVPELMKHRRVWRDVLLASASLQLIALATPLFTQAIIDKVVVHRTESTLIAIGIAMAVFMLFTSLLTWVRQYLVLHTGNRVDAVLGAAVWEHLLKLPLRYFEHRPTGVVAARLHGVETIREFVAGAAVSLVLDLPFLIICLAVMVWYSPLLTAISVGVLSLIAVASAVMAPIFQTRLNEQFMLGARNQAFVTEHIAGFETVKSLQMEPQLRQRYAGYLASYLQSGFRTKQIANSYNVVANTMEQAMTLLILMVGAWTVMTDPKFSIGMLVAFQMFSGKLSQPVLRIVGLWTQFQQAKLAVDRLGDVMNAPFEPYSLSPKRQVDAKGRVEIDGLSFRYGEDRPWLYQDLSLKIQPGAAVAIMGPSGSGKSTLAKLLLGFYQPSRGTIRVDGVDIGHLAANELRSTFGVVPQETLLFSGTVHANLIAGNPAATFEQVVQACRMAGIHDVVEALPQGYQTEVGERGAGLSGGQKQRLAIARALLKGPKVLIFDEATSALDGETAESFAKTINGLKGRVTMLFITHGMPRNLKIDQVIQLSKGAAQPVHLAAAPRKARAAGTQGA